MKFSTLAVLIALSPAAALAAGTERSDISSAPLQKTKFEAAFFQAWPCAAPEKALRWAYVKKPASSASRDSVGPDDLKKVVKITPLVKSGSGETVDQAEPVMIVKPAASSGRKPRTCGTGPGEVAPETVRQGQVSRDGSALRVRLPEAALLFDLRAERALRAAPRLLLVEAEGDPARLLGALTLVWDL